MLSTWHFAIGVADVIGTGSGFIADKANSGHMFEKLGFLRYNENGLIIL